MPWSIAFMVVAIVMIVSIARVSKERHRAGLRHEGPAAPIEDSAAREEMRRLKERIQVLERVITDDRRSNDLDREIDRLRDH